MRFGRIGAVLGTGATFVAATVVSAVVNLGAGPTRRLVASEVSRILASTFAGRVTVEHIGGLGLSGISGVRARVWDPEGREVLFVDGVRVRVHGLEAARSALLGHGPIRVRVDEASIEHVEASVDADASGEHLRLARAFAPRKEGSAKATSEEPGRGVLVEAPDVALRHAWIHGAPPGAPRLDGEVRDLRAGGHVDPSGTEVDLGHAAFVTRGMPRGVDPSGAIRGHARLPTNGELVAEGALDGTIAGVPTRASGRIAGARVDAQLDVARASGDRLRSVIGGEIAPRASAELHAEAHGDLPRIDGTIRLRLGGGQVDVDGTFVAGPEPDVRASIAARHIDVGELASGAPVSDLGLDGRAHVHLGPSKRGEVSIDTLPGRIARRALPPARMRGGFANDEAWAGLRVTHPDMPTEIALAITRGEGGERRVDADVHASAPDLSRLPAIGDLAKGEAHVRARGRLDLGSKALVANVELEGAHLEAGGRRVGALTSRIEASGTTSAPIADAELHAAHIDLGVTSIDRADAHARVGKGEAIVVTDPAIALVKGSRTMRASASNVTVAGKSLHVVDAMIEGLGQPLRAEIDRDGRRLRVQVDAPGLDLATMGAFAGRSDVRTGRLAMNGDVIVDGGDLLGQVHAKVDDVAEGRIAGGRARVDARFDGRDVDLAILAGLGRAGHASIRTDGLVLDGPATEVASWRRARGHADVEADVSLEHVAELVPPEVMPLSELRGEIVVRGAGWRRSPEAPPRFHVTAYTRGLVMAGKVAEERPLGTETRVKGVAPWRSQDFDVQLDARVDPEAETNELAIRLHDRKGIVAALDAKALLPVGDLFARPEEARARLAEVPLAVKIVVPERELAAMPSLVGVKNVGGSVAGTLDVSGTALRPSVALVAKGRGMRAAWLPLHLATDGDVRLTYDGQAAELDASVRAEGHEVLALGSRVEVAASDLVRGGVRDWVGGARVDLDRFPLEAVNALADRRVKGRASGHVELDGLHRGARAKVDVTVADLRVGRARYTSGRVTAEADASRIVAATRIEQSDGWLAVRGEAPVRWGAEVVPSLDATRPVHVALGARGFRVAALSPFVQGPLNELDGRLDADAELSLGGGAQQLKGRVALRDGRLQVAALGEELREIRADVVMRPDGTIAVDDVFAKGTEGELTAKGTVRMAGLSLASAEAEVHVPKPLDFAVQGEPVGRVTGDLRLHAQPSGGRIAIRAEVPELRAELPQSMKGGLQQMTPPESVRAGVYRAPNELVQLPLDKEDLDREQGKKKPKDEETGTPIDVDVKLGEITVVRGNQVRVVVSGNPRVTLDDKAQMSGRIVLQRGKIDVQGKSFEIDHGTVTFDPAGEPSNPTVVATATWTAADGTKVFADFVGPVKTGKVNLRSEPPRPKNEILALILFGTADGINGAPAPPGRAPNGTTKAAVGIGGGFAAQGLTEALDDLAGIQATARIDTTESNNPRPEVEVQIAKSISVAFGHVLGTPPITDPDKNLVTLDWRFRRNWSLETTFGDRGRATLDAIWQKRY